MHRIYQVAEYAFFPSRKKAYPSQYTKTEAHEYLQKIILVLKEIDAAKN